MKLKVLVLLVGLLVFPLGCSSPSKMSSQLSTYKLRPYKDVVLSNGLRVLFVEDKSLPYVSYSLMLGVGSSYDPVGTPGLSSFVSSLIDKGTQKHSATEIADELGQIGADLGASTSVDFTSISASGLSFHEDKLLEIFSEVVAETTFQSKEVERVRKQTLDAITRQVDEPDSFASDQFQSYIYGEHPYAHSVIGTAESVKKIRRKDLIRHYRRYYRPNNAMLAVVGNYSPNIQERLEKVFGSWAKKDAGKPSYSVLPQMEGIKIRVIDKADLVQSQIRIGHFGIKRNNPDYLKIRLANTILGGGFASRLMQEIRVRSGLTYGINSSFDARIDRGPFVVSTFTRNDKVGETIRKTINEIEKFRDEGVTAKEVSAAKALMLGNFPRAIETAEKLAYNLLILRMYGISDDYLNNFTTDVSNISAGDVNDAIKKYFSPDKMKILIYSNAKSILKQISPIGGVEIKPYKDYL